VALECSTVDMIFSFLPTTGEVQGTAETLYMAFIDLTKAFDLVSLDRLFNILLKNGFPLKLHSKIRSFQKCMKATTQNNGSISEPFDIKSGVKQDCVLTPNLFGILFSLLLKHAFRNSTEGVYMHTKSDGRLYNISRLKKAKTKVREIIIREAAVTSHTEQGL